MNALVLKYLGASFVIAAAPLVAAADGESDYKSACFACHDSGVAGAPKIGDTANWVPRIEQGMDTLYKHAIEGYQGEKGYMPPKGGSTLSDEAIKVVVDYMVEQSK